MHLVFKPIVAEFTPQIYARTEYKNWLDVNAIINSVLFMFYLMLCCGAMEI